MAVDEFENAVNNKNNNDNNDNAKEETTTSQDKDESELEVVVSGEANETRANALIKKYKQMANTRRDYEDIDIKDCIPTLDEMIQDDLMYEILEKAANGGTEEDVLSAAFYTEEPPTKELGYKPDKNVFIFKARGIDISDAEINLNKVDGDTFNVPLSSIIEPEDSSFTLKDGKTYENFKEYCYARGIVNRNDPPEKQNIQIRMAGVNSPEIPHYEIQMMKESDIVQMTLEEARNKNAVMEKYKYNGTSALDRNDEGKISFYKVKNSSGGYSYHEIKGDGSSYVTSPDSNYVYKQIVVKDESTKETLVGGYAAKQNMIDLINGKEIYLMIDANGLVAEKTSGKYKLYYNHWWNAGDAIKDMIDQWCSYTNESALTRLSYSPYGTDSYGRFVASAYTPKDGLYVNVAKYNIADGKTKTDSVSGPTNSPEMSNLFGNISAAFELYSYDKNNQIWLDSFNEMTKQSYLDRIEFHKQVSGIDFIGFRNCTMMIGDTLLLIPPQNIRSLSSIDYEKVGIMRGKGSMIKNNTNREMFLEVDLFFYNGSGINGIPVEVEMPNKEKIEYHMNGLRSLIAQFKVAPYLPIENQFVNDVLGIEAVSLMNLNVSTVEGIPRLLQATLTLREFNYRIYMPDIPINYSYNQVAAISKMDPIFAKCFNWEVFRYYYQRMISAGGDVKQYEYESLEYKKELYSRKEVLQPIYFCEKDGFGSSTVSFYIPDENWLKNALTLKKDKEYYGQAPMDVELTPNAQKFFEAVGGLSSKLGVNSTYAQRMADHCKIQLNNASLGDIVKTDNVLVNGSVVKYSSGTPTNVTPQSSSGVTIPSNTDDMFKGYNKATVDGGDLSGSRQPNTVVDIGYGDREYYAFTNEYGQVVKVMAKKITLQDESKEPTTDGRYYEDEAKVPGTERGDLDEGHIIADSLGGVSNAYNITPQNSTLNREGTIYQIEDEIRKAGGCTDFVAVITYPNSQTQIPSHYSYTYNLNGIKKTVDCANEEPNTKEFDKNNILSDLLTGVSDNIESCDMLVYNSANEEYNKKTKSLQWKMYFDLTDTLTSEDVQSIKENLKNVTGLGFDDVLKNNQLEVVISTSVNDGKISPDMKVTSPEIFAMSNHNNGVDPTTDMETYNYLEPAAMQFIPYIENIELQHLSFSLSNNFSDITLKIMDGFAPQYMGSSDISIDMSFITTNTYEVSMVNVLPAHASNIGKLYRKILSCWPIKVRNQYLQLAGINEVLIDLVEVKTVEGFPGAYEVRMRLTSVDRTIRQRETMKQLESDEVSTSKASASISTYWDLNNVLSAAELYPDLDLPSLKELKYYGYNFLRYKNSKQAYPDPDFYMSYAHPYTSYIIKKNLKDTFYNKIFHDEGKEKAEILDETNYKFFDQMGMELYRKLDPYSGTTEATTGKTQNSVADEFDKQMEVIDSATEETIKKSKKEKAREIQEEDCADLSNLLIYLTACDIQEGWEIKPGYTAPLVINETNLSVEKLECSGIKGDDRTVDDLHNAYAQDIFNLRAETIKAIDDYLSDPIDYDKYNIDLHATWASESADGYGGVISKVVEAFATEDKGKKILQLLNPFEDMWEIVEPGWLEQAKETLKGDGKNYKGEPDYTEAYTLNYLAGFLYSAAKTISAKRTYNVTDDIKNWEPCQYQIDEHEKIVKDNDGNRIPNCKVEINGKPMDRANSLKESLEQGFQWGMFQIKRYRTSELIKIMKPKSKVTYLSEKEMPMYKDPKTGKERWHPGFIDPYYNIAGYRSQTGKEYIEKIATNEGINTIAFIRVVLMHLRRMMIDGQIFSELDIVSKDYEEIKETIKIVPNGDDFNEAAEESADTMYKNGGVWGLPGLVMEEGLIQGFKDYFTFAELNKQTDINAIEAAVKDEDAAGTILELLENLPETYKRSFCARLIYPVLMATSENSEEFNDVINKCYTDYLNGVTAGACINAADKVISVLSKFCNAMFSIGMMDFSVEKTDPETTSDSQKLWNYIMREAYTRLSDDPQAYVLHSYYDMLINDKRGRLIRAFPTYYVIFVDEGRKIGSWKLFDNFYNMSAISEITVSKSRKIPADTCSFVMSNMYSSYAAEYDNTTRQQYVDVYGLRDVFNSIFCPRSYFIKEDSLRRRKDNLETVVLKPGVRIHVRMGYGSDASRLPIAFNGKIAEIDTNEVVQVIAQGDGVELYNPLNTLGEIDAVELTSATSWITLFKDFRGSMRRGGESPRNLLSKLLTAQYGGVVKTFFREVSDGRFYGDNPFGIYHFGDKRFNDIFEEGEIVQNLYEVCDATLLKGSNELYTSRENAMATPTINTSIQDKTFWDILHLCAHSGVGYKGAIRDFGMRSTICLCKPNHYYAYGYKLIDSSNGESTSKIIEKRKPFQQFHYYDSYTDIVYNSIKASEKIMKTNAVGLWESTDMIWGRSQSTVGPIYLDMNIYPEHQKSMTVDTTLVSDGEGGIELNLFTHFSENWSASEYDTKVNKALAERVTTNVLRDSVSDMYCGELCILGDTSIKPYDRFYINDYYEDMQGHMEVEAVVYSMSSSTGFTTTVYPDLIVRTDDPHEAAVQLVNGAMIGSLAVGVGGRLMGISTFARIDSKLLTAFANGYSILNSTPVDDAIASWGATKLGTMLHINKAKNITEAGKLALQASMSLTKIITSAAIAAGVYIITNNVKSWASSFLRNIQALTVYPITKNQRPLIAGMSGHKGSVYGYEYSQEDKEDSIQGMICETVNWIDEALPFNFGTLLANSLTRNVTDSEGNTYSEYERIKKRWAQTLPLEGEEPGGFKITEDTTEDEKMEVMLRSLYDSSNKEFSSRKATIQALRVKYRIPSLLVLQNNETYQKYSILDVPSYNALATNKKVLGLYPIEDDIDIKKAVVKGSHEVVKQLEIAHSQGNLKVQMPFESGNRIIKLYAEQSGDKLVFDLPMLQEDALLILKLILNEEALKKKKVHFISGTRVNDVSAWKNTGFAFILDCNDKSALLDAIEKVQKDTTWLNGDKSTPIFEYKDTDKGVMIIVYAEEQAKDPLPPVKEEPKNEE